MSSAIPQWLPGTHQGIFITHQHSDHNAAYGPLWLLGWTSGLSTVDAYGPPPLAVRTHIIASHTDVEDVGASRRRASNSSCCRTSCRAIRRRR